MGGGFATDFWLLRGVFSPAFHPHHRELATCFKKMSKARGLARWGAWAHLDLTNTLGLLLQVL